MPSPILITGMGLYTGLGANRLQTWDALVQGKISTGRASAIEGQGLERAEGLVHAAALEALIDAGLWTAEGLGIAGDRVACTVSASKPFLSHSRRSQYEALSAPSPALREREDRYGTLRSRSPLTREAGEGLRKTHSAGGGGNNEGQWGSVLPPDAINDYICQSFGFGGERRNVIAACATGAYSIALAASWITQGLYDVVVAGSVEPYPNELIHAGFSQMGVLSADDSTRPFDRDRSGFVIGEGAGVVVLESEAHALQRGKGGAPRLSGWALGVDGHSAVAFNSNGQRIANIIGGACTKAGIAPEAIGHVNAHGTATRLNDWIETQALEKAFGDSAGRLMISATKSSTGHLLGAAGSVEFILTVMSLERQFVPPTVQLRTPDPDCRLDYTPGRGHAATFDHALNLSFGFGGPIGALVVSR